jgi:hypothetical protein
MNVHEDREELERLILAHTPRFQTLTKEAENRIQASGGMDHNEFWDTVIKTGENTPSLPSSSLANTTRQQAGACKAIALRSRICVTRKKEQKLWGIKRDTARISSSLPSSSLETLRHDKLHLGE